MTRAFRIAALPLLLASLSAAPLPENTPSSVKVGALAPDFRLKLVDDSVVTLADVRGQVVVINFWATWCAPCKKELPLLDAFYRKLSGRGLRVFAITTESSLPIFELKPLFAKMAIPAAKSVKGPYGSYTAVPYNIVIDRTGRVRYAAAGSFDIAALNSVLIPLLNEPAPTS